MVIMGICRWILIAGFLFAFSVANAAEGCAIGSQLYTVETTPAIGVSIAADLKVYQQNGNSCYNGVPSTAKACFVCTGGGVVTVIVGATPLLYVVTCGNRYFLDLGYLATRGTYYSSYALNCDLDDYTITLAAVAGTMGLFAIRKRKFA